MADHGEAEEKEEVVTLTTTIETNLRHGQADAALVAAKGKEEVATLTATVTTNPRQGDLETEVDGMKGDLTVTETESNEASSEWEDGRLIDC